MRKEKKRPPFCLCAMGSHSRYNTSSSRRSRTLGSAADVIEELHSNACAEEDEDEDGVDVDAAIRARQLESLRSTLRSMRQQQQEQQQENSSTLKSHSTLRSAQQQHQITAGGGTSKRSRMEKNFCGCAFFPYTSLP